MKLKPGKNDYIIAGWYETESAGAQVALTGPGIGTASVSFAVLTIT